MYNCYHGYHGYPMCAFQLPEAKDLYMRSHLLTIEVNKMKGIQLDYKIKKGCSSRFNQKMFGRISTRTKNSNRYSYYVPGVLDEIPYTRIFDGRVFIATTVLVDFDPIMGLCCEFQTATVDKEDIALHTCCGRNRWKFHAQERGFKIDWE